MIAFPAHRRVRRTTVGRAEGPVELTGRVAGTPWARARVVTIDRYPWPAPGERQATRVRMLVDAKNLYLQFRCRDRHSFAAETRLNGDVYLDSCVEFFAGVDEQYFNLEINCGGTIHLGFGPGRRGRKLIDAARAGQIRIATSVTSPVKNESPPDDDWWVALRWPLAVLRQWTGRSFPTRPRSVWRGNFYRCGGRTDPQHACWSPIDPVRHPEPDFHRPEYFGRIEFA